MAGGGAQIDRLIDLGYAEIIRENPKKGAINHAG
jgi:hypothetical protein